MEEIKLIPREIRQLGFPRARKGLLEQEQQTYEEACKKFNSKNAKKSLNVPTKGSNLWKALLLNDIGIRTANIPELECALENGLNLRGTYEDGCEVILRSRGDNYENNDFPSKDLVKKLNIKGSIRTPLIVTGLKPVESEDSYYGLVLGPTDRTEIIKAPDFSNKNNLRKFSRINPDYSIEFDGKGNRTLYARGFGLSGLDLDWDLDLGSSWYDLAGSDSDGRVVVISGEATAQKFLDEKVKEFRGKREKENEVYEERISKFKNYVKTGKL